MGRPPRHSISHSERGAGAAFHPPRCRRSRSSSSVACAVATEGDGRPGKAVEMTGRFELALVVGRRLRVRVVARLPQRPLAVGKAHLLGRKEQLQALAAFCFDGLLDGKDPECTAPDPRCNVDCALGLYSALGDAECHAPAPGNHTVDQVIEVECSPGFECPGGRARI